MIPRFIGVVHLPPLPGDPRYLDGGFVRADELALADAEALAAGGVDGIIIENFGSVPFTKGTSSQRLAPHVVAFMARLTLQITSRWPELAVGVNCLRNDAQAAMGIAAAGGLDFIRVNVHTGASVTDQGIIEGEAWRTMRQRRELEAEGVKVFADVLVKHAAPLAPTSIEDVAKDTVHRGLADAVIVTGSATGAAIEEGDLEAVRRAVPGTPVLLGSGTTPQSAAKLGQLIDGAIVGTWLKHDGRLANTVDPKRVATMASALGVSHLGSAPEA